MREDRTGRSRTRPVRCPSDPGQAHFRTGPQQSRSEAPVRLKRERRAPAPESAARRRRCPSAPPTSPPQQDAAAPRSKGDASLSAHEAASPAPGAGGVRGSAAGAAHACDGPAGCSGSAVRQGAAHAAAPDRHNPWSSRCCRGRSAGKGRPDGDRRRRRTGGRRSSSRPMRTRWTPAKSRTILRVWAVPGMARGVRRRPLPPSRSGQRRIVLSRPSVLPPIPLSGPRDRWPPPPAVKRTINEPLSLFSVSCPGWNRKVAASAATSGANRSATSMGSSWKTPNDRAANSSRSKPSSNWKLSSESAASLMLASTQ